MVQLHFKDWPDFGVPESTEPIRQLVRIMDFYRDRARAASINGPILIHCSAGIGRTGTYLAIVFALNAIKHMKQLEASSGSKAEQTTGQSSASKDEGASDDPETLRIESLSMNNADEDIPSSGPASLSKGIVEGEALIDAGAPSVPFTNESPSYSTDEDYESSFEDPKTAISPKMADRKGSNSSQPEKRTRFAPNPIHLDTSSSESLSDTSGSANNEILSPTSVSASAGGAPLSPFPWASSVRTPSPPTSPDADPFSFSAASSSTKLTSPKTDLSSWTVSSSQERSKAENESAASIGVFNNAPTSPSKTSTTQNGRNTLTHSADSVEYETKLLSDSSSDLEDEEDSEDGVLSLKSGYSDGEDNIGSGNIRDIDDDDDESDDEMDTDPLTDSEEDAADLRHVRSFQKPGSTIPVDVMKIVLSLRKQRNRGMVQTEDQYKFIYRVVFDEIYEQKLNVSGSVMQFMADASSDFTDSAPMSARLSTGSTGLSASSISAHNGTGGSSPSSSSALASSGMTFPLSTASGGPVGEAIRSARRKSQPRSPRSTQQSLGSSVSIGASGVSRLSSSTASNTLTNSSSFSDDEGERKARLKASSDTSYRGPLLSLDASTEAPKLSFAQRRSLARSCANIQPNTSGSTAASSTDSLSPRMRRSSATITSDASVASSGPILDLSALGQSDGAALNGENGLGPNPSSSSLCLAQIIAQQQQEIQNMQIHRDQEAPSSSFGTHFKITSSSSSGPTESRSEVFGQFSHPNVPVYSEGLSSEEFEMITSLSGLPSFANPTPLLQLPSNDGLSAIDAIFYGSSEISTVPHTYSPSSTLALAQSIDKMELPTSPPTPRSLKHRHSSPPATPHSNNDM